MKNMKILLVLVLALVMTIAGQAQIAGKGGSYFEATKEEQKVVYVEKASLFHDAILSKVTQNQFATRKQKAIATQANSKKRVRWFRKKQ